MRNPSVFRQPPYKEFEIKLRVMTNKNELNSADIAKEKEFLKINDMLEKLGVTRTQFWRMQKLEMFHRLLLKTLRCGLPAK
jgi:hypothetical protein